MKTSLEFDTTTNSFVPKPSQLQVVMLDENKRKHVIGESDFDLARFSTTQQVTTQIVIQASSGNGPGFFELVVGQDHIEIVVKTIDLGESETPTTTIAGAA